MMRRARVAGWWAGARGSIGWRLGAGFMIVAVLALALLSALAYQALHTEVRAREGEALAQKLTLVRHLVAEHGSLDDRSFAHRLDETLAGQRELAVWIAARDGRLLYGEPPAPLTRAWHAQGDVRWQAPNGRPYRLVAVAVPAGGRDAQGELHVVVGLDASAGDRTLKGFGAALVAAVVGSAVLASALALVAARIALRPLAAMQRDVQRVTPGGREARLALGQLPVELRELGAAFNAALDRLQQAYAQLEAFSADVAHELRTPLSNIAGSTEVWLSRNRSAAELRGALQENLVDIGRLRAIVNDMLFLARADRGERPERLAHVSLAHQAREVADFHELAFEERGLALALDGDAQVVADVGLLRRAMSNLLDNAARHATPGSAVELRVRVARDQAWTEITNIGAPLDVHPPERIFDRFVRGDPARGSAAARTGLGLAIVKAVAAMHGGQVRVAVDATRITIGFSVPIADRVAMLATDHVPGPGTGPTSVAPSVPEKIGHLSTQRSILLQAAWVAANRGISRKT